MTSQDMKVCFWWIRVRQVLAHRIVNSQKGKISLPSHLLMAVMPVKWSFYS